MNKRWLKDVDLGLISIQNTRKKKNYTKAYRELQFIEVTCFLVDTFSYYILIHIFTRFKM